MCTDMLMSQESTQRLAEETKERKRLHNLVQELKGNIRVFCFCMFVEAFCLIHEEVLANPNTCEDGDGYGSWSHSMRANCAITIFDSF
jgi:hypothetical protein